MQVNETGTKDLPGKIVYHVKLTASADLPNGGDDALFDYDISRSRKESGSVE
jgi:hypothetical protein